VRPDRSPAATCPVGRITVRDLSVVRGRRVLFEGLDLDVGPGECVVIVGPSGTGKSSLLDALSGLVTPTRGKVGQVEGQVGYLFQDPALFDFDGISVHENLGLAFGPGRGALPASVGRGDNGSMSDSTGREADSVTSLLESVGLDSRIGNQAPGSLSGGQRRRVGLARCLAAGARVLLLDEPTAGLDTPNADLIARLIRTLCIREQLAVIIITHDTRLAAIAADRVLFFRPPEQPVLIHSRDGERAIAESYLQIQEHIEHQFAVLDSKGAGVQSGPDGDLIGAPAASKLASSPKLSPPASEEHGPRPDSVSELTDSEGAWASSHLIDFLEVIGRCTALAFSIIVPSIRQGSTRSRFGACLPGCVWTAFLASFAVGAIVILQSQAGLARFEAGHLLAEVAMGSLVRNVLPLFGALILAGRLGAWIASEVGILSLSRQIDSMRLLGLDPDRFIAGPTVRAAALAVPLALVAGALGGVAGAATCAIHVLGLNEGLFWEGTRRSVVLTDLLLISGKGILYGIGIAVTALRRGMQPKRSPDDLGRHTTAAIVEASFVVVLLDLILSRLGLVGF